MDNLNSLIDMVHSININNIELPVLRNLVRRVQETSSEQLSREDQMYTDGDWRQYKEYKCNIYL